MLLVLGGESGAMAAAMGFSQKAARRAVSGYVLVDAVVPPAESRAGDWPDAPVHYVASPAADPLEANQARLRGWTVHEVADAAPTTSPTSSPRSPATDGVPEAGSARQPRALAGWGGGGGRGRGRRRSDGRADAAARW